MWKCPVCGTMNRSAECTSCGALHAKRSTDRPVLSAMRFFVLLLAACAFLAAVFFTVHIIINERHRQRAEVLNQDYSYEHFNDLTSEEQDAIREAA